MLNRLNAREGRKPRLRRVAASPSSSGKSDLSDLEQKVGGLPVHLGILAHHGPGGRGVGARCDPSPPGRWTGTWENKRRQVSHGVCSGTPSVFPGPHRGRGSVPSGGSGRHCRGDTASPSPGPSSEFWSPGYLGRGGLHIPGAPRHPQAPNSACLKLSSRPPTGNLLLARTRPLTVAPPFSWISCRKPGLLLTLACPLSPRTSRHPALGVLPSKCRLILSTPTATILGLRHPASLPSARPITAAAPPRPRGPSLFPMQQSPSAGLSRAALCPASPPPALLATFFPAQPAGAGLLDEHLNIHVNHRRNDASPLNI